MGDGYDIKGLCTVHRSPVGAVRRRSLARFEDIHIVRLAQHGCDSRTRRMYRSMRLQNPFDRFFSNLVIMLDYVRVHMSANMVRYNGISLLQSWFEVWVEHKLHNGSYNSNPMKICIQVWSSNMSIRMVSASLSNIQILGNGRTESDPFSVYFTTAIEWNRIH